MLAASIVTGFIGLLAGALTLRLRRDYLAITTFGVAVMIQAVANNATRLTGGPFGVQFIPKPGNVVYLVATLSILTVVYLALERLVHSPWGRALRTIRENEEAAAAIGKRVFFFRLQSFVVGSMLMGLGGALYAHFVGFIAPEDFLPILTFQLWAMLIVGGSGSNKGAILGALVVWGFWSGSGALLRSWIPQADQARAAALQTAIIGILIAATLIVRPRGILGRNVQ
jgi:branched-chain amino acid transport system permease protein